MSWSHVSRKRTDVGYAVSGTDHPGGAVRVIGFVNYERGLIGPWRAWCSSSRCHELGSAWTKAKAVELVEQHYLVEHR